ncbi:MAG: MMPL family transporter [Candidatus Dormibacteraceae bacterium]
MCFAMMLDRWAGLVHRHRWLVLAASVLLLVLSLLGLVFGGSLSSNGFGTLDVPSQHAQDLIDEQLPAPPDRHGSQLLLMLRSGALRAGQPGFAQGVARAASRLRQDERVASVTSPVVGSRIATPQLVSQDGHTALLELHLDAGEDRAAAEAEALGREAATAAGSGFSATVTGGPIVDQALLDSLSRDLARGEGIAIPITLLLLLLIFGSVVAGLLPLGTGVLAVLAGIGAALSLANLTTVSQFALDLVALIGLGVSIDYSLFITSRFKEELGRGATTEEALRTALATAGRAIAFSGVTVAVALCSLLFIPDTYAVSMGYCSAISVIAAVVFALTFLPAVLSLLGERVNRLRVPLPPRLRRHVGGRFWRGLALHVMRRPLLFLAPTLAVLLLAGIPFLGIRLAGAGLDTLAPQNTARQNQERVQREFPIVGRTTFGVVVDFAGGAPLTPARVGELYDLSRRIARLPGVSGVEGPLDAAPGLSRAGYQQLLTGPAAAWPPALRAVIQSTVGPRIVLLTATSNAGASSPAADSIVTRLRAEKVAGARVLVAGDTASTMDEAQYVVDHAPLAVGFVILVTLAILFLLTGSLLLPLASVLTNLVSIAASLGALVWVFQDGHLSTLLDFTPQPIDPSVPVLLFAAVFGLSMDYQVLLLSRIQEQRALGAGATEAVATGLARSGGLITGAAAIMVTVFLAFALAEVVIIKSLGLALALAVAIDATLVRALVVPSLLRLLGHAAWWAPGAAQRLFRRIGLGETPPEIRTG